MDPRKLKTTVVVHCADVPPGMMAGKSVFEKMAEVRRWHVEERGWADVGYAALIDRDGSEAPGRDLDKDGDTFEEIGAHVGGHNKYTIGVCLWGGRGSTANDQFSDHYTPEQDEALRAFIRRVEAWKGGPVEVRGHNEFAAKACPGFNVPRWYREEPPRKVGQSTTLQASLAGSATVVTAGATAVSQLDGTAQLVVIVAGVLILAAFAYIARERIRAWARGVH